MCLILLCCKCCICCSFAPCIISAFLFLQVFAEVFYFSWGIFRRNFAASREDMMKVLKEEGKSEDSCRMLLCRMLGREMIMEKSKSHYRKLIE